MAIATLEEFNGTQTVQLDATQTQMLETELRRVRGGWLARLLTRLITPRVRQFLTAPDCLIRVTDGGRVTEYQLHGGYVLHESREGGTYTFYMGLLLLEWLYGINP